MSNNTYKDSFVYIWINKKSKKQYIGYHKGKPNDGYVCSSQYFLKDYNNNPNNFKRKIIFKGTKNECIEYESKMIRKYYKENKLLYNRNINGKILYTNEYLKIMSERMSGKNNPMYGKVGPNKNKFGKKHPRYGKKQSDHQKKIMSKLQKGKSVSMVTREKMKKAWLKRKLNFISPFIEYHKYKRGINASKR